MTPQSIVLKDPHLHLAHGGLADFRGRNGRLYNFFSAPGLSVNLKTEDATFPVRRPDGTTLTVDGSFLTEMHLVASVGGDKRKWANLSYWATELTENNWGWRIVSGFCGGHFFKLGRGGRRSCDDLSISIEMATANIAAGNWSIVARGGRTYATTGPEHRVDVSFNVWGDYAARYLPHGIFGQSFTSPVARHGKVDRYPHSGRFATSAMAEGAIEGTAAMYEMDSPYATHFKFSRFDAMSLQSPVKSLLAFSGASASAVEGESR